MTVATDRLPAWTLVVPVLALGTYLALHGAAGPATALALAIVLVAAVLGDRPEPTLLRDTIHAVVVLVLHGVAGLCIVVGAIRHRDHFTPTRPPDTAVSRPSPGGPAALWNSASRPAGPCCWRSRS